MNTRSTSLACARASGRDGMHSRPRAIGVIRDAGLSPDGKTLLVSSSSTARRLTARGNIFRGDITTARPASMRIHGFDRSSETSAPYRASRRPPKRTPLATASIAMRPLPAERSHR